MYVFVFALRALILHPASERQRNGQMTQHVHGAGKRREEGRGGQEERERGTRTRERKSTVTSTLFQLTIAECHSQCREESDGIQRDAKRAE